MIKLTEEMAELIGMHVGDGTLYKTAWSLVWELRGCLNEKDYYYTNVVPLLKSIFDLDLIPKFRSGGKNGCFGVQTSNKIITNFFIEMNFNPGRKTHTVRVPAYIKNSTKNIKFAFLRGYFDTDGCLRFERINNKKVHTYPKLEFVSASEKLRDDVFNLLLELDFRPNKWGKKYYKICLAGKFNLEKFIKEIAPKNKKHLSKYEIWVEYGQHYPNAAVA